MSRGSEQCYTVSLSHHKRSQITESDFLHEADFSNTLSVHSSIEYSHTHSLLCLHPLQPIWTSHQLAHHGSNAQCSDLIIKSTTLSFLPFHPFLPFLPSPPSFALSYLYSYTQNLFWTPDESKDIFYCLLLSPFLIQFYLSPTRRKCTYSSSLPSSPHFSFLLPIYTALYQIGSIEPIECTKREEMEYTHTHPPSTIHSPIHTYR